MTFKWCMKHYAGHTTDIKEGQRDFWPTLLVFFNFTNNVLFTQYLYDSTLSHTAQYLGTIIMTCAPDILFELCKLSFWHACTNLRRIYYRMCYTSWACSDIIRFRPNDVNGMKDAWVGKNLMDQDGWMRWTCLVILGRFEHCPSVRLARFVERGVCLDI